MIVKKFQADTETEAILKAKEELGNGAVVLNVKTLKQRGIFRLFKKDVVEVTAALEEKDFINGINNKKPTFDNKKAANSGFNTGIGNMKSITESKPVINLVADEKIDVNGESAHPIYKYLKNNAKGILNNEIKWNFTKFLIDSEGNVVDRFAPTTNPKKIRKDIEKLLP